MSNVPPSTADTESAPPTPRVWDMAALGVLAVALRLPVYFAGAHVTFDDGVFGASAIAMRHGGAPFREVFSSQGPLFLPLLWLGDLLGGRTLDSPRFLALFSGVALAVLAYWAAIAITDRTGALVAGAVVATSGTIAWISAPAAADGPALMFAIWAVGLAFRYHHSPSMRRAIWIGIAVGASLSTKAIESHILVPVGIALAAPLVDGFRKRRLDGDALRRTITAGLVAVGVFVASALPWGWSLVWDQAVTYHSEASEGMRPVANTAKVISTLWDRDLVLYLLLAICVTAAIARRVDASGAWFLDDRLQGHHAARPSDSVMVASWAVAVVVWLAFVVSPMWRSHVSAVALSLALVAARWRPPRRALAVVAVAALPLAVLQLAEFVTPGPYRAHSRQAEAALRAMPAGAWAISDDPGLIWRAGRRTTDDLVDTSELRVQQGRYTTESIAEAATDRRVCAVITTSKRRFGALVGLPERLEEIGYVETTSWSAPEGIWIRRDCDAPTDGS